jgi:hypothetical protein
MHADHGRHIGPGAPVAHYPGRGRHCIDATEAGLGHPERLADHLAGDGGGFVGIVHQAQAVAQAQQGGLAQVALLACADVDGGAEPLADGARGIEQRHRTRQRPAGHAVGHAQPVLVLEHAARADRLRDRPGEAVPVVRMDMVVQPGSGGGGALGQRALSPQLAHLAPVGIHPVHDAGAGIGMETFIVEQQRLGGVHGGGDVDDGHDDAADLACVPDRAVAEVEPGFLGRTAALEHQALPAEAARLAAQHRRVDRTDEILQFGPGLALRPSQRVRMARPAQRGIAVVVDLDPVRPPQHGHRQRRMEHQVDQRAQRRRPAPHRSQRRGGPVMGADQRAERAAAGGPGSVGRGEFGHEPMRGQEMNR